jgi:hypothetical protein
MTIVHETAAPMTAVSMTTDLAASGPMPGARRLLCVLGMHRSGTSAVTQLLHRLGAQVGPQLLEAMGEVNDDGFWEDSRVVELNERLLALLGSRWQDIAPLDFAADAQAVAALRLEAEAHFRAHYAGPGIWVVKDPRLCRLLPFWLDAWRAAGFETCFVNVLRHPFAVAKSLHRRDRIPVEYGVVLWLQYTLDALSHGAGQPGIVVAFDAFARDPLQLPALLESQAQESLVQQSQSEQRQPDAGEGQWQWPLDKARWQEVAAAVVKQDLRHHDDSLPAQIGLRDLMVFAATTYAGLCASSGRLPDSAQLAALRTEWQALLARYDDELVMLRRTTDEIMALSAECVRVGTLHSEALAALDDRAQLIRDIAYFRFWRLVPRIMRRISRR